jgi:hypothetical protein
MSDTGNPPWYETFDDIFWLTVSGSFFGFLAVMLRACLKSRCTRISCCGLECNRDLSKEVDTSDIQLEAQPVPRRAEPLSRTSSDNLSEFKDVQPIEMMEEGLA